MSSPIYSDDVAAESPVPPELRGGEEPRPARDLTRDCPTHGLVTRHTCVATRIGGLCGRCHVAACPPCAEAIRREGLSWHHHWHCREPLNLTTLTCPACGADYNDPVVMTGTED